MFNFDFSIEISQNSVIYLKFLKSFIASFKFHLIIHYQKNWYFCKFHYLQVINNNWYGLLNNIQQHINKNKNTKTKKTFQTKIKQRKCCSYSSSKYLFNFKLTLFLFFSGRWSSLHIWILQIGCSPQERWYWRSVRYTAFDKSQWLLQFVLRTAEGTKRGDGLALRQGRVCACD